MEINEMNDLQAVDNYIENCRQFVKPRLLYDIQNRGLYDIINFLPIDIKEAKAVARARMSKLGKYFGDDEIDYIANEIQRLEFLRDKLNSTKITNIIEVIELLSGMQHHAENVRNYFK